MSNNRFSLLPANRRPVPGNRRQTRSQTQEPTIRTNDRTLDPPISTRPLRNVPMNTSSSSRPNQTDNLNDLYDDTADELDRLEQSITLSLQQIDRNIAETVRVVSDKILPVIDRYSKASNGVWNGAKFWKQFFETSANVSLNAYSENAFNEENIDNTLQLISQAQEDRITNGEISNAYNQSLQVNSDYENEDNFMSLGTKPTPNITIPSNDADDIKDRDISIEQGSPRGKSLNFNKPYQMTPGRAPGASFLEEDSVLFHNLRNVQQSTPRNQLYSKNKSHNGPALWENEVTPLEGSKNASEKRFLKPQIRKNPTAIADSSFQTAQNNNGPEDYPDLRENSHYDHEEDISDLPIRPVLRSTQFKDGQFNKPSDGIDDTSKDLPESPVLKDSKLRQTPGPYTSNIFNNSTLPGTPSSIYPEATTLFPTSVNGRTNDFSNSKDSQSLLFDSNLPKVIYTNPESRTPLNSAVRHQVLNQNWRIQVSPVKATPNRGNMGTIGLSRGDNIDIFDQITPRRGEGDIFEELPINSSSILPSTPAKIPALTVARKTPQGKVYYDTLTPRKEPPQYNHRRHQHPDDTFSSPPPMMDPPRIITVLSPVKNSNKLANTAKHGREPGSTDISPVRKRKTATDTDDIVISSIEKGKGKMKEPGLADNTRVGDNVQFGKEVDSNDIDFISVDDELPALPSVSGQTLKLAENSKTHDSETKTNPITPRKVSGPEITNDLFNVDDDLLITPSNEAGSKKIKSDLFKDAEERKRLTEKYGDSDDDSMGLDF